MDNRTYEKNSNAKFALAAVLSVIVFVVMYKWTLNQVKFDGINDLREHMWHAESIYLDRFWTAWLKRPYLLWHLCVKFLLKFTSAPLEEATACVHAAFAALNCLITFFIIDKIVQRISSRKGSGMCAASVAGMLGFVMPMYIWWFNHHHHEGQWTINPFFNPTHMAVKPFGLLTFALAVDLILRYRGQDTLFFTGKRVQKYLYILWGGVLLLSTFIKPTFIYMLLPAGAVFLLIDLVVSLCRKDGYWKKTWSFMWRMACACIPSLIYLLLEFSAFYFWGGTNEDAHVAVYPFLYVWKLFSPNIPKSIVLGMSFPIWMVLTNWKYFWKSVEGRLSLVAYFIGFLEFSFFVETGFKLTHCNFSWPLMSGMLLLWVISGAKLVERTERPDGDRKNVVVVTVGWILLAVHFFSGLYYINPYQYII